MATTSNSARGAAACKTAQISGNLRFCPQTPKNPRQNSSDSVPLTKGSFLDGEFLEGFVELFFVRTATVQ